MRFDIFTIATKCFWGDWKLIPILLFFGICFLGFGDCSDNSEWDFMSSVSSETVSVGNVIGQIELIKDEHHMIKMAGEEFFLGNRTSDLKIGMIVTLEGFKTVYTCNYSSIDFKNGTMLKRSDDPELFNYYFLLGLEKYGGISCNSYYGIQPTNYYIRDIEKQMKPSVSGVRKN